VLIASGDEAPPGCELLLNLAADCPPHFARFERLLEIVAVDGDARQAGRSRYRYYLDRGYQIANHDLAAKAPAMPETDRPDDGEDVPVLTEIVEDEAGQRRPTVDGPTLEPWRASSSARSSSGSGPKSIASSRKSWRRT